MVEAEHLDWADPWLLSIDLEYHRVDGESGLYHDLAREQRVRRMVTDDQARCAIHQAPTDEEEHSHYPFHLEFHPPLRQPDTLKYLAGPEIGGGSMTNESDPDEKAAELRNTSTRLYRSAGER